MQVTKKYILSRMSSNIGKFGPKRAELAPLGVKKSSYTSMYNGEKSVYNFCVCFIRSFKYLLVTRTCIKSWMGFNFGLIRQSTTELADIERLKY